MVTAALAEWTRWGRLDVTRSPGGETCVPAAPDRCEVVDDGCGREQAARWCPIVNEYWAQAFIGSGRWFFHDCSRVDVCAVHWPAGTEPLHSPAWSAAFISTVMDRAGLGDARFPRTPYHVDYILAARDDAASAYRVTPVPAAVSPGSLVCWRRTATRLPVQVVANGAASRPPAALSAVEQIAALRPSHDLRGPTPMHCDIVVEVDREAARAWVIGGNVQQSVSRLAYPLDSAGRVFAVDGASAPPLLVLTPRDP